MAKQGVDNARRNAAWRAAMHVKRGRRERISRYAPFGFRFTVQGVLEPEAREQGMVTLIHELKHRGLSLRQTAAELTARCLVGRSGRPLSPKTVRAILRRQGGSAVP